MEFTTFWAIVGAVIFSNGVSLMFAYALWSASKSEQKSGDLSKMPTSALLCGMVAPVICAASIFFTVSW